MPKLGKELSAQPIQPAIETLAGCREPCRSRGLDATRVLHERGADETVSALCGSSFLNVGVSAIAGVSQCSATQVLCKSMSTTYFWSRIIVESANDAQVCEQANVFTTERE